MTELKYLSDTYLDTSTASIEQTGENEMGKYVILDATIFYPQGGGQPSDTGTITSENAIFRVEKVRLDEAGIVYHYGYFEQGNICPQETVTLSINIEERLRNARNHSGGHLIDVAMKNIGLGYMHPTKGYHFLDGCYVEYEGNPNESFEIIQEKLQMEIEKLIKQNIQMNISYDTESHAPLGKTPRYAQFGSYEGCGCGGTHISSSSEIGILTIKKIKMKDGKLRLSYETGLKMIEST